MPIKVADHSALRDMPFTGADHSALIKLYMLVSDPGRLRLSETWAVWLPYFFFNCPSSHELIINLSLKMWEGTSGGFELTHRF